MGRMYVVSETAAAVTAAQAICSIDSAAAKCVIIHRIALRFGTTTDDQIAVVLDRMSVAPTSGAAAPGANPLDPGDAADSATCRDEPTGGTIGVEIGRWNMSTLAGLEVIYTPEERPVLGGGDSVQLSTEDAPTASTDVDWMIVFEEIG